FGTDRIVTPRWVAIVGATLAFAASIGQFGEVFASGRSPIEHTALFTGLLIHDPLTVYMRILLCGFLVLMTWLTAVSGIPDREDGPDFHTLLFGSTLGALLMAQSNNLLMLFLAVEMTSVPGYVLVGFQKGRRQSGEAALKYLVYGAGAAGVLLYGTSLVAGTLGTASLAEIAMRMPSVVGINAGPLASPAERTIVLGSLFIFAGLAFKLALVPFHFWCPDAFEGASAEIAGFLSVAPKAAAFALLVRVVQSLFGADSGPIEDLRHAFGIGLAVVSALTMTLGNLAAFGQSNVKRLFAYSTIAHAGYLLMGVAAWMVAGGEAGLRGLEGLFYYLAVYVFMNLGAFAIIAIIRNATFSEEIDDYAGLWARMPIVCGGMAVCCLSLIGIWPAGGFIGKFMVFAASLSAGWVSPVMWALVAAAAINTVWSLFYYARVLRAMYLESPTDSDRLEEIEASPFANALVLALTIPVLLLGVFVEPLSRVTAFVARSIVG
ncbi:MAG: NADH-quinone oxidoreductase subunit N, partial [Planctomycetota bacterium]|nr:NADH-quinone oxidoreductase subunit N [Planctomycetota bacterium]